MTINSCMWPYLTGVRYNSLIGMCIKVVCIFVIHPQRKILYPVVKFCCCFLFSLQIIYFIISFITYERESQQESTISITSCQNEVALSESVHVCTVCMRFHRLDGSGGCLHQIYESGKGCQIPSARVCGGAAENVSSFKTDACTSVSGCGCGRDLELRMQV